MKVVLLDNIRGIGRVGDIKEVSDGYGRNFLLKRGLAKGATEGAVRDAAALKAKKLESSDLAREEAQKAAAQINGMVVNISAKANKQGKLFAGIEAEEIASALSTLAGVHMTPKQIHLDSPLKTIGEHPVTVELTDGVRTQVSVVVAQN